MISSKNSNFIFSDLHTTFNTREILSTTADFYLRFNIVLMVNRSSFLGKTPPLPVIFPITTRSIICAPVAPTAHCHKLTNGNSWSVADLVRIFSSFSSFVVLIGNDWDLGSLLAVRGGLATTGRRGESFRLRQGQRGWPGRHRWTIHRGNAN